MKKKVKKEVKKEDGENNLKSKTIISLSMHEVIGIVGFIKDNFEKFRLVEVVDASKEDKKAEAKKEDKKDNVQKSKEEKAQEKKEKAEKAKAEKKEKADAVSWIKNGADKIKGISLDQVAFGRMLADNNKRSQNSICEVSHMFTVHECKEQYDAFTAVNDWSESDNSGSAHMGTRGFNEGVFYGWLGIDLYSGSQAVVSQEELMIMFEWLFKAYICSNPGGKMTTMASNTRPFFIRVEIVEDGMPYSYDDVYRSPIVNNIEWESISRLLNGSKSRIDGYDDFDYLKVVASYNFVDDSKKEMCEGFDSETKLKTLWDKVNSFIRDNMFK